MNVKKARDKPDDPGELRRRAEAALCGRGSDMDTLSAQQVRHLIHELEVHQIELELQNDELRRAQQELEVMRDKYADLYDFAPIGYLTVSEKGQILEANLTIARLLGMERGVLRGQWLTRFIAFEDQDLYYKHCAAVLAAADEQICEIRMVTRGGTPFDARMQSMGIADNDGTVTKWRTVISDVTKHKQAEQALHVRNRAMAAAANGIMLTDWNQPDNPIIYCNPAFEKITGYTLTEVLGRNPRFLQDDDRDQEGLKKMRAAIKGGSECHVVVRNYRKDGTLFWNELTISPVRDKHGQVTHFVGIQHDITERKQKEAQLLQAQKMEVVGQLTGGIAHDFNNLLTVILGNLRLLANGSTGDADEMIEDALSAARDAAELARRLLAFSRKQPLQVKRVDVNELLGNIRRLLQRTLRVNIELRLHRAKDVIPVIVDPGQFENAMLNLVINARDAMPGGGVLIIETARKFIGPEEADELTELASGNYTMITVSDSGVGMSPEDAARAIEPFYTTKGYGQGTGWGLSLAYGFARQSGGGLLLRSVLGKGTTVSVLLPEVGRDIEQEDAQSTPQQSLSGGAETILLVEDQPQVRKFAKRSLLRLGYRVLEAEDAATAMKVFDAQAAVDLLFSDIVMPGDMNGRLLARWALQRYPRVKVLLTTGFSEEAASERSGVNGGFQLLSKPYTKEKLAKAVRTVLDTKTAS
jgi:two-component system cell cycle sensor histidine kinase/response regulator CckA